jgi:hypothetical protein
MSGWRWEVVDDEWLGDEKACLTWVTIAVLCVRTVTLYGSLSVSCGPAALATLRARQVHRVYSAAWRG